VKAFKHPQVTQAWSSFGISMPDPNVHHVFYVETTLPLSEKQDGYNHDQVASLIEVVGKYMEVIGAKKAEIISTDRIGGVELKNPAPN
jgi:hypothetical protein